LDKELKDKGFSKQPLRDGNGWRYNDGKGGSIQINKGYPKGLKGGGGDSVHKTPYLKIQPDGIRQGLK